MGAGQGQNRRMQSAAKMDAKSKPKTSFEEHREVKLRMPDGVEVVVDLGI